MQIGTLRTGKPIYRMSSFAPTRGQVDPQGYLQRELRKQGLGSSGAPSDSRSGLARTMLGNRGAAQTPLGEGGYKSAPTKPEPKPPAGTKPGHGAPGSTPGTHPEAPPPATTPFIHVNENGTLDLPFDFTASSAALGLTQDANAQLLALQQGGQQEDLSYQTDMRDASKGYIQQKRDTLNSAAATGNAFGSAYGYAAGQNANEFANTTGSRNIQHSLFGAQTVEQRGAIERDFNAALQQLILQQGIDAAGSAGSLGYGTTKPPGKPKPKPHGTKGGRKHPVKGRLK